MHLEEVNSTPQCPVCSKYVKVPSNASVDAVMNRHIVQGCKTDLFENVEQQRKKHLDAKYTCALGTCSNAKHLEVVTCKQCRLKFCLKHRHASTHKCSEAREAKQKKQGFLAKTNNAAAALLARLRGERESRKSNSRTKKSSSSSSSSRSSSRINKARALGKSSLDEEDRVYFKCEAPTNAYRVQDESDLRYKELDAFWPRSSTVGKVLDDILKHAGVDNRNHIQGERKLALFGVGANGSNTTLPHSIALRLLEPQLQSGDRVRVGYAGPQAQMIAAH
jgi:hypothetical protein